MLERFSHEGVTVAELKPEVSLGSIRDAKDAVANAAWLDATHLLLTATQLPEGFFDLRTGVAGEVMQTAATFRLQLLVTGDLSHVTSQAFQAFRLESNRNGGTFFADRDGALASVVR